MFALIFLGLVASASTANWNGDAYDNNNGKKSEMHSFDDDFKRKMNNDMINANNQQWPTTECNEHKINIYLTGFNKEDIVVKAKKGKLVIVANHNVPGEPSNDFLFVKDLPDFVDENGSWSYNNGLLTVYFTIVQLETDNTRESNLPYYVNIVKEKPNRYYKQGEYTRNK